jgi:hypothetical protein
LEKPSYGGTSFQLVVRRGQANNLSQQITYRLGIEATSFRGNTVHIPRFLTRRKAESGKQESRRKWVGSFPRQKNQGQKNESRWFFYFFARDVLPASSWLYDLRDHFIELASSAQVKGAKRRACGTTKLAALSAFLFIFSSSRSIVRAGGFLGS